MVFRNLLDIVRFSVTISLVFGEIISLNIEDYLPKRIILSRHSLTDVKVVEFH